MIKAVIFDWAGTLIDHGSFAPMGVFVKAFKKFDIDVTPAQARLPMGMPKWQHIEAMLQQPEIAAAWQQRYGKAATNADIDAIYEVFVPMNEAVIGDYSTLIPGALATIDYLQSHHIKIGTTTGYTRSIMARVLTKVAEQGFTPASLICADDLIETRPGPLGIYQSMINLGVYPPSQIIKVDDTVPGIGEGKSAGCITVGVSLTGNYVGMSAAEVAQLSDDEKQQISQQASEKLRAAGADYVIYSVADLPKLIQELAS